MGNSVYNQVSPRLSLRKEPQKKKNLKDPANWPKSLHNFISASFAKASELKLDPATKKTFQAELKSLINLAIDQNKVEANDWERQTLPSLNPQQPPLELELRCNLAHKNAQQQTKPRKVNGQPKLKNVFDEGDDEEEEVGTTSVVRKKSDILTPAMSFKLPPLKKSKVKSGAAGATTVASPIPDTSNAAMTSEKRKQLRSQRFERELSTPPLPTTTNETPTNTDKPLVGTCQTLEKRYLRLTSQPNPATVRPLPILKKTLQLLIDKYLDNASYSYLCDQFKSLRQDLTVQHIRNAFAVTVYEFHSKLAIQFHDLGEFNQCQSQLKLLYNHLSSAELPFRLEFFSYRILYHIITNNIEEAFSLKAQLVLANDTCEDYFLQQSFKILQFVVLHDYHQLFGTVREMKVRDQEESSKLDATKAINVSSDKDALKLNKSGSFFFLRLLEPILQRERINALAVISKAYRKLSVGYLQEVLLLDTQEELEGFVEENGLKECVTESIDCVKCRPIVEAIRGQMLRKIDIKGQI